MGQQARVLRKDYAASRWWPNQDAVPNQVHKGKPWDPEPQIQRDGADFYTLGSDYRRFASGYGKIVRIVLVVYALLKVKDLLPKPFPFFNLIEEHQAANAKAAGARLGPVQAQIYA